MDGSLGSSTAMFFEPYTQDPSTSGLFVVDREVMKRRILEADKAGLQVAVHSIGDKSNHDMLTIFSEVIKENGPRDRRFRIEHAQHMHPDDYKRFAELGVIASMQPYQAIDDGRFAEKRIGNERCKQTFAFNSFLRNKAILAFGSDWPVAPLEAIVGIYAAVTRRTLDDKNPGGWFPEQKITVEQAIRAFTLTAAYAQFQEDIKGSITVGKLADMVVLSEDILSMPPEKIETVEILYTIVDGKIVYQKQ
jgi:predicted amidohydrolase YtcJ